jgi:hypothetical protein
MATAWVLGKVSDALAPTVSGVVSTAGGFAGGAVNAVGNSINGVGASINNTVKTYGDGVKDYGNSVMDWTAASGVRGGTASNPLGLAGTKTAGQRATTSPSVYHAPKQTPSKTLMTTSKTAGPQKKIGAAPTQKALPAAKTATTRAQPAKKLVSATKGPTPSKPVQNAASKTTASGKKTVSSASRPQSKAAPKPAATAAPKPAQKLAGTNYGAPKAASNPLGLSGY